MALQMSRQHEDLHFADPATPQGMIQRGTGAGHLWALDAPRHELQEIVIDCIARDFRLDGQIDSRTSYFADLVMVSDLPRDRIAEALAELDRGVGWRTDEEYNYRYLDDEASSVLRVLGHLAARGDHGALRVLFEFIEQSPNWFLAVDVIPTEAESVTSAFNQGLLERIEDRYSSVTELAKELDFASVYRNEPGWKNLAELSPRLEAAFECIESNDDDRPITPRPPDPEVLSVPELLARPDFPERAPYFLSGEFPALQRREVHRALAQVGQDSIPLAREWMKTDDWQHRSAAASVFEANTRVDELDVFLAGLNSALIKPDSPYEACGWIELIGKLPEAGPFPLLNKLMREFEYSYGRSFIARALANTDPAFCDGPAVECLWDCEPVVRGIGCDFASTDDSRTRPRLEQLAAQRFDDEAEVAKHAEDRLDEIAR